ncbi:hypothetical protein AVL61_12045 [Kocuria rosea subsp. polaris]|uniref:Ribonucleotide reductase large subunit C-terminal domain-containing protein n=1 Tax=Kocuria rosea subsp. polaris TaxID=136273 RepID=A0A0W8I549_KOCRO|nr:hypothetical protein AVL61_12045 [Kocuria polaris]
MNGSNLRSEFLRVSERSTYNSWGEYDHVGKDISCNLGSMNIAMAMDGGDPGATVGTAVRGLTTVSDPSDIHIVPSIAAGNARSHAIELGQMNLHGFLGRERIHYDSVEAVDLTSIYFGVVTYHAVRASNLIAIEKGGTFDGFSRSKHVIGEY